MPIKRQFHLLAALPTAGSARCPESSSLARHKGQCLVRIAPCMVLLEVRGKQAVDCSQTGPAGACRHATGNCVVHGGPGLELVHRKDVLALAMVEQLGPAAPVERGLVVNLPARQCLFVADTFLQPRCVATHK